METRVFKVDHLETGMAVQKVYSVNGDPYRVLEMFSMIGICPVTDQTVLEFSKLVAGDLIMTDDSVYVILVEWEKTVFLDRVPLWEVFVAREEAKTHHEESKAHEEQKELTSSSVGPKYVEPKTLC